MFKALYQGARDAIIEYANFIIIINLFNKLKKVFIKAKLNIITKYKEEGYYLVKEFIAIEDTIQVNEYSKTFTPYAFDNNNLIIGILKLINILKIIANNRVYIYNLEPDIAQ